jgi:hypothetical protein
MRLHNNDLWKFAQLTQGRPPVSLEIEALLKAAAEIELPEPEFAKVAGILVPPPPPPDGPTLLKEAGLPQILQGAGQSFLQHGGQLMRGLGNQAANLQGSAQGAATGGGLGGLLGGLAGAGHAAMNPVQEGMMGKVQRYLFGGHDPNTMKAKLQHILAGGGQGALAGGGLGAGIGGTLGGAYINQGRMERGIGDSLNQALQSSPQLQGLFHKPQVQELASHLQKNMTPGGGSSAVGLGQSLVDLARQQGQG